MNEENGRKRLLWALFVINAIAGVVWVLGSFGVMTNEEGINLLYLAIGRKPISATRKTYRG
jgi:hypothetical protein